MTPSHRSASSSPVSKRSRTLPVLPPAPVVSIEGEVIGEGEEGCVIKGNLCTDKEVLHTLEGNIPSLVSKIVSSTEVAKIKNAVTKIKDIDPKQDTVVYPLAYCTITAAIPEGCTKLRRAYDNNILHIFTMPQGIPLTDYIKAIQPLTDKKKELLTSEKKTENKQREESTKQYRIPLFNSVRSCLLKFTNIFHTKGIVHGDIHIGNIVIMKDGTSRLIDFNPYMASALTRTIDEYNRTIDTLNILAKELKLTIINVKKREDILITGKVQHLEDIEYIPFEQRMQTGYNVTSEYTFSGTPLSKRGITLPGSPEPPPSNRSTARNLFQ